MSSPTDHLLDPSGSSMIANLRCLRVWWPLVRRMRMARLRGMFSVTFSPFLSPGYRVLIFTDFSEFQRLVFCVLRFRLSLEFGAREFVTRFDWVK